MINFITLTNNGYKFFADIQIENFKSPKLSNHNLDIYCVDSDSYQYHSSKDLPNNVKIHKIDDVEIGGQYAYLQGRFKEMMRLKFPLIINCINKLNGPVWFIDNDVIILEDPESYIDSSKDIIFQADCEYDVRHSWVCTGCFWINNTQKAINLLNNIIELQSTIDRGEQELLNDYCKSWPNGYQYVTPDLWGDILKFEEAKLDIFPFYLFQSGLAAFKNGQYDKHECVMIHFNHVTDFNVKVENFNKVKNYYKL